MSKNKQDKNCGFCCNTGIVFAGLVKDEEDNNVGIDIVVCTNTAAHYNFFQAEKTAEQLQKSTGLKLNVLKEKPQYTYGPEANTQSTQPTDMDFDQNLN